MNFDFGEVSSAVSTGNKLLKGDAIHEVTFDGCEYRTIQSKAGQTFNVLDIKFSNDEGTFSDITWQAPSAEETEGSFGKQPSQLTGFYMKIQHLLDTVNPAFAKKLRLPADDPKKETIRASSWEGLCKKIVELTEVGKGVKTRIKLLSNNKGQAIFPGFLAAYNREGKLYMRTTFIGNNVMFSSKELEAIAKRKNATPSEPKPEKVAIDFNIDLDGI